MYLVVPNPMNINRPTISSQPDMLGCMTSSAPDWDKVRQCGSGAERQAMALRADQGLYKRN